MEFTENKKFLFSIGKGVTISFLFTVIALLIFSVLLVYTNLSEETIKPVIITLTGISILLGSSIGTKKLKKNGIINGGLIGGIYILSLYILSSVMNSSFNLNFSSIIMVLVGMICGILGGIIGVNSKL